ncbi:histidinol-phosphate transaminase [Salirhabdus salicampi]|uniref:histidinol-phosphate transaminase n=1 Tax=Salirhabdus salicampi TaxID=476102 RepID=UPI0020C54CCD|nr:histidinol-phosphate transaminase [Salirhabdus salicampi]MCP8616118.1 histidinol-phosphate transaminase [Salirhabdus salicampi]
MSKFWSDIVKETEPYVPGEQPRDPDIIKLNTNENPYPPSPKVIEAIKREIDASLRLYPDPKVDSLLETISETFGVKKDEVFVGNGSDEVLAFAFMAFFNKDQTIRFPDITYSFYPVYSKIFQIPYETVPLKADYTIPVESFYNSEGGVIFPNPNAPTGILLSLEDIEVILKNNENKVVIVDEAYIDFGGTSVTSLVEDYNNLLVIQTLSKSRSLAGLRVGFAIGSQELIEGLNRVKNSFNSYTIDRLALVGAKAAIEDESYFAKTRNTIIETRQWVGEQLRQLGFTVLPSQANFLFAQHENAKTLYEQLKDKGIYVRYFEKERINQFLRITVGTDEEMKTFIHSLQHILRKE